MENMIKEPICIEPKFTKEELDTLAKARTEEIVFDEDCPETTPEKAIKFKRVNEPKIVVAE